tara:strand:+ start:763 stop:942 length:180 start_codon:yes stop_codon:yes gene_type:complete
MTKRSFTTLTLAVKVTQPPGLSQKEVVAWILGALKQPGPLSSFANGTQVKIIGKETMYL